MQSHTGAPHVSEVRPSCGKCLAACRMQALLHYFGSTPQTAVKLVNAYSHSNCTARWRRSSSLPTPAAVASTPIRAANVIAPNACRLLLLKRTDLKKIPLTTVIHAQD